MSSHTCIIHADYGAFVFNMNKKKLNKQKMSKTEQIKSRKNFTSTDHENVTRINFLLFFKKHSKIPQKTEPIWAFSVCF